jgi:hypothetical protein
MSQIQGKIKVKGETLEYGSNGFLKREVVITTSDEKYPQHILIEFVQDKTSLVDAYDVGDEVKVSLNILGRIWESPKGETKYFNSLQGWKIEGVKQAKQDDNQDQEDDMPWDKE